MDKNMKEEELVILVDEDGGEHEFYLIDTMELDGEHYAILLPAEEDEEDEGEVIILKIGQDETGAEVYYEIEDDDEWERVADAWEEAQEELSGGGILQEKAEPAVITVVEPEDAGKICPFCQRPLRTGSKAAVCPRCKTLHHKECWEEGQGCANEECGS